MTVAAPSADWLGSKGGDDRRRAPRSNTSATATVREFGRTGASCEVRDFSSSGCRLQDCDLSPGAEVWIKFTGIAPVRARVVWAHSGLAGCQFYESLSPLMITLARLNLAEEG